MEEENIRKLLKLAFEAKKLREDGIAELSNDLNLIDEININENANTKILLKLLQYKEDERYPFLISFLKRMNCDFPIEKVSKPVMNCGKEYIDGLIEEQGQYGYGIVIENKIYGAADQNIQIGSYVNKVKDHGINQEYIYVIYLTSDGNKKIEDYSFTEEAKDALKYTDAHKPGRFVEMNYRDHILPWLKEDVLPEIKAKNAITISAVHQYIDYLEGFFNLRKRESQIYNNMREKILKSLSIDPESFNETKFLKETWEKLDDSQEDVEKLRNEIVNIKMSIGQQIIELWERIPKEFFGYNNINNQFRGGYFQLQFNGIPLKDLHFEWYPCSIETLFTANTLPLVLHAEHDRTTYVNEFKRNTDFQQAATKAGFQLSYQGSTVGSMEIKLPEGKTFAKLSPTEQEDLLKETYSKLSPIKEIVEDLFNSSNNKAQEK